jgi:predicted TIM-barrel fold metal-dependent hydrolase
MANPKGKLLRLAIVVVGLSIVVFGLAMVSPVARLVLHKLVAHRVLTVPVFLLALGTIALLRRRRFGLALLAVFVAIGLTGLYGVVRIQYKYPNNIVLELGAVPKVWNLLIGKDILLSEYQPRSTLRVDNETFLRANSPVIDVHFHMASLENVDAHRLVEAMDSTGIAVLVDVDGGPGYLGRLATEYYDKYPDRFAFISFLNLNRLGPEFPDDQLAWMELAASRGARGFKVYKSLGLRIRDESGELVGIDDPRLAPLWDKAAELGLPMMMHTTDPTAFWQPPDRYNERAQELLEFPGWGYADSSRFPDKEILLAQRENLLGRHPQTIFIGAHVAEVPEDLAYLGHLLDTYPNFYVDISSRIPELGRQPYTARRFFIRYQDRILFGTDGGYALGTTDWTAERYFRSYMEFLETDNEYIEYPLWGINKQGRWRVYGLHLPDEVLRKVYYENAARLILKEPG